MIIKDITGNKNQWKGLRMEVRENLSSKFLLESGLNTRFKLSYEGVPLFWGTFGEDYWGVWLLINKFDWEVSQMPIPPINSPTIEKSKNANYHLFWTRFFAEQLEKTVLSTGLWTLTIGAEKQNKNAQVSEIINDIDETFIEENPRWVEWDIGRWSSIVALKNEPDTANGRVKWFRKLVRESVCPPVLVWYLRVIDGYIILDGHNRLKAFQLEDKPIEFLVLNNVLEETIETDEKIREKILFSLQKRQENAFKTQLSTEETNAILLSAYDKSTYFKAITKATAKPNFEAKWMAEIKDFGEKQNLKSEDIEMMIDRTEP